MPRKLIYLAALALFAFHQDWWLWDAPSLVLGFLPAGLAYHVVYSLACAALWLLAVRYAWPQDLSLFAERDSDHDSEPRS